MRTEDGALAHLHETQTPIQTISDGFEMRRGGPVRVARRNTRLCSLSCSSRLFRKKNPQEGQEKSNSIINILCTVTPRKVRTGSLSTPPTSEVRLVYQCCIDMNNIVILCQEMSHKDLETIENIKWDPPYDPASGWKKSSINVKNYGRMIHSSKVRFRFLHCQVIATKERIYSCAGQKVSKSAVYLGLRSPTKTKTPMTHPTAR